MACTLEGMEGSKIYIGTAVIVADCTAVPTQAEFEAIADYTNIGVVESFNFDGQDWNLTNKKYVSGESAKVKQSKNAGNLTFKVAYEAGTAGGAKLKEADNSKSAYAFKIEYADNTKVVYGQGLVTTFSLPDGGEGDVMERDVTVEFQYPPIDNL